MWSVPNMAVFVIIIININHDLTAIVLKVFCEYTSLPDQIDLYKNAGRIPVISLSHIRQYNSQSSNTTTAMRACPHLHFSVLNFWIQHVGRMHKDWFRPNCVVTGPLCISVTNVSGQYAFVCCRDNTHMTTG